VLYLDTSALLPYYRQEAHSDAIQQLLQRQSSPILISDLTRLEFASALSRWVRMREIEESHAQRLGRALDEDIKARRYTVRHNTDEHIELARHWLLARNTSLRTLDALHLACAAAENATLVTLDDALGFAATQLGIKTHEL
jgi:predicted nucleic acid-binding protein